MLSSRLCDKSRNGGKVQLLRGGRGKCIPSLSGFVRAAPMCSPLNVHLVARCDFAGRAYNLVHKWLAHVDVGEP